MLEERYLVEEADQNAREADPKIRAVEFRPGDLVMIYYRQAEASKEASNKLSPHSLIDQLTSALFR